MATPRTPIISMASHLLPSMQRSRDPPRAPLFQLPHHGNHRHALPMSPLHQLRHLPTMFLLRPNRTRPQNRPPHAGVLLQKHPKRLGSRLPQENRQQYKKTKFPRREIPVSTPKTELYEYGNAEFRR